MTDFAVAGLWVLGLAGILTTLSHRGWQRSRGRNRHTLAPAAGSFPSLAPPASPSTAPADDALWLHLSFVLVTAGLFLNAWRSEPRSPTWILIAWGALVVLSCSALIASVRQRTGYAAPTR